MTGPERPPDTQHATETAGILDLFEEYAYAGEILPDGRYVDHSAWPTLRRVLGGPVPEGTPAGTLWESRIDRDDWAAYEDYNRTLLGGEDAEVSYRLHGLDGVTRVLWDRARPSPRPGGGVLVHGIISDVTLRAEADARAAEASERFSRLLDVVGEHVYLAQALADGSMRELFQGPGADRLLGGAEPDAEMANWEAAVHPDDRVLYDAFNEALAQGAAGDVEYRLIGADGVTRWVHDRAATRRREDGTFEISGIVSDVTERRRMRAELTLAHAALSRVVEAMDDHLYTLEVLPDGTLRDVYRGPNREALTGGPLPADDRAWASFLHPGDRALWQAAVERLPHGEPVELEYRVLGLDGEERIVLDHLRPRREPNGALLYDGVTRDITERRRLEDELRGARAEAERRARTDELTGAHNRRHFAEIVAEALTGDARGCGLLLLDADHFKQVNDLHGHVVGDAVLVELARRLEAGLARGDCLARWGGEEFAVLLRDVGSDAELDRRAQRLRAAVACAPVAVEQVSVRLTISVGATRAGAGLDTLDALVEAADRCLYVAKRHGRNRVSLVPHLSVTDAPVREPEAIAVARALALAAGTAEAHATEVARLATLTAERMALPPGVVLRCGLGGWLHGADERIVRGVPTLREAAAAIRHRHERYDGTGGPDGLAGAAIPIEARIVAAADACAALTGTPAANAAALRASAGTHLDPGVVGALLDVLAPQARRALRVA